MSLNDLVLDKLRWDAPGIEPTSGRKDIGRAPDDVVPVEEYNWYRNQMELFTTAMLNAMRDSFSMDLPAYYGNTKLADDFQDASLWSNIAGTQSTDTVNVVLGNQALRITENDGVGGLLYSNKNNAPLDFTILTNSETATDNDIIVIDIFVSNVAAVNLLGSGVRVIFDKSVNNAGTDYKFHIFDNLVTGKNRVYLAKTAWTTVGSINWNEIGSMQFGWESNAGFSGEYVTAQLIQLVKKDPVLDIPNPLQRFGVVDFNITDGDWFVGIEFGELVLANLQNVGSEASLIGTEGFRDFTIYSKVTSRVDENAMRTAPSWVVDGANYIRTLIDGDTLYLITSVSGVATSITVPLTTSLGDSFDFKLVKSGTIVSLTTVKNGDINNPITLLGSFTNDSIGYLGVTTTTYGQGKVEALSITEITHAHHADIAEVAKSLVEQARVEVKKTATQSIPHNTPTVLVWVDNDNDNRAHFNPDFPTRLYARETGLYLLESPVEWISNPTGRRYSVFDKNGVIVLPPSNHQAVSTGNTGYSHSRTLSLSAGDYVEVTVFQDSGVAINVADVCFFAMTKIG